MTEPTEEEIEEAIEALVDIEHAEGDFDHQRAIAECRRMVAGVFDKNKFMKDFEGDERIDTLKKVLESIDPENQHYAGVETVERAKEDGLEFAEIYDR